MKRAYAAKAAEENNEEDDEDDAGSSDYENEVLDSDEDELNDAENYLNLNNVQERIELNSADCPFNITSRIEVSVRV